MVKFEFSIIAYNLQPARL